MIKIIAVDLGSRKIQIPVAQIVGRRVGKRLLVTAGTDGDEYAGIEAAYKIIEEFSDKAIYGQLTVIPILNIPGFEAGQSKNPLDNKFPKHIFPGKKDGTASERLIYWLSENYINSADVWVDLHGGGMTERLDPYIYLYETKNKMINNIIRKILQTINSAKIAYERPGVWKKVDLLAKRNVAYIFTEAGCSGERNKVDIEKHIEWTKTIMRALGMTERDEDTPGVALDDSPGVEESVKPHIYRQIRSYKAKHSGLWYPNNAILNSPIKKGQFLGEIQAFDGRVLQRIIVQEDGEYLWMKESLFCYKKDTLLEIGCEPLNTLTY